MLHTKALDHWPLCSRGDDFERFYQAFSSECVAKNIQYFLTKHNCFGYSKEPSHCNVKITPPAKSYLSVFSISGSLFHVLPIKMRYLVVSKKKNPLFVRGWDRKIRPS